MGKLWEKIHANRLYGFYLVLTFFLVTGCGVESTDIGEGYGKAEKTDRADSISFSTTELSGGQQLVTARRSDGTTFSVTQLNDTELKIELAEGVLIFDKESGDITVEEAIPPGVNLAQLFLEIKQASEKMLGSLEDENEMSAFLSVEEASLAWDDSFELSPTQDKWIGIAYVSVLSLALGLEARTWHGRLGHLGQQLTLHPRPKLPVF